MLSLRSILLLGLPLASLSFAESQARRNQVEADAVAKWEEVIEQLPAESLRNALEGHLKPKYRDGVFEDGRDAIDAVRSDDPELASKLVDLAKQDAIVKDYLRKRQNTNSTSAHVDTTSELSTAPAITTSQTTVQTTTEQPASTSGQSSSSFSDGASPADSSASSSPPTTSPPAAAPTNSPATTIPVTTTNVADGSSGTSDVVSSAASPVENTQTGVLIPVQVTTTNNNGGTVVQTTQAFQTEAPTSVAVAVTTTNDRGQAVTTSSMAPAAVVTSVNEQGSTVTTASPLQAVSVASGGRVISSAPSAVTTTDSDGGQVVLSSPTPGGVYTTRDSMGRVVTVTYQPGGGVVSQLRLQTTTLPNGMRSTITSFAEVGQQTGDSTLGGSGGATPSATNRPGLQSGAAVTSSWYAAEFAVIVGAAIGVAGLVL